MFTPFIQYTIDSQDLTKPSNNASQRDEVPIVETEGCLQRSPAKTWALTKASDPVISDRQGTTSAALRAAEARPLGNGRYQLLGAAAFNPSSLKGQKVAVKGALIKDPKEDRLNVTSLQLAGAACF